MPVKMKDVFVIPPEREGVEKTSWPKVGVAFVNRDESLNVILDAVPVTGKIHIRDRRPGRKDQEKERTNP